MVRATGVPRDSEIGKYMADAYWFDAFEVPIAPDSPSALAIYLDIVARTPQWINCLMAVRNRVVGFLGLKQLGDLGSINAGKKAEAYRVGDRVGTFVIRYLSDDEVIFGETDRHLDAKVSLRKLATAQGHAAVMTTVIKVRNLLGHCYVLCVWPAHKLIMPSLLARADRSRRVGR